MGLWYDAQGAYCGLSTVSEVFFFFYNPTMFMSMQLEYNSLVSWQDGSIVTGILHSSNTPLSSQAVVSLGSDHNRG